MYILTNTNNAGHGVSKAGCEWSEEEKIYFVATLYLKVKKIRRKSFKSVWTQFILDQNRVSIFLTTVQIWLLLI